MAICRDAPYLVLAVPAAGRTTRYAVGDHLRAVSLAELGSA